MSKGLAQLIKQAAAEAVEQGAPVNVTYGTVESIDPLKIQIDDSFPIMEGEIILTSLVRDRKTKISFDNPSVENIVDGYLTSNPTIRVDRLSFQANIKNEITIYDGLKVGERVILLRVQGGQKFIVWDRLWDE